MNTETATLAAQIRAGMATRPPHEKAAAELLIGHGDWLEDEDFYAWLVMAHDGLRIRWDAVGGWASSPQADTGMASTTHVAILKLAVAIATDEYELSRMDGANSELIVRAFAAAMGRWSS